MELFLYNITNFFSDQMIDGFVLLPQIFTFGSTETVFTDTL